MSENKIIEPQASELSEMSRLEKASLVLGAFIAATALFVPLLLKPKAEPQIMLIDGRNISDSSVIVGRSGVEVSCNNDIKVSFNSTPKQNIQEATCGQITKRLICRLGENLDKIPMQHIVIGELSGAKTTSLVLCEGSQPSSPSSATQKPSTSDGLRL